MNKQFELNLVGGFSRTWEDHERAIEAMYPPDDPVDEDEGYGGWDPEDEEWWPSGGEDEPDEWRDMGDE